MTMEKFERLGTFHDAELRTVSHKADVELLELGFEKADGQFVMVSLRGIAAFRVTDMRTQNVVSRLLVHGANIQFAEDEILDRVSWVSRTCEGEQLSKPAAIYTLVQKVKSGEQLLFVLEPSWGAEMIVIAEELAL
jgi:hypothetical protein